MKRVIGVLILAAMIAVIFLGLTQPSQEEPPGYDPVLEIGAAPARANWYFTCSTHRMHHTHYLREVIHTWKNIVVLHRGGERYVRGTWDSTNMNSGNIFASDRRTYGPC